MDITNLTSMDIADNNNNVPSVLGRQTKWEDLFFYQKADVVYQLSFVFCDRFIHLYKTALAIRSFRLPVPANRTLWRGWLTV